MSRTLVALQFGLMALVMLRFDATGAGPGNVALLALGFAMGAWTLRTNPPGNFNVRPEPKAGGHLATTGPYRYVRHPMYLAVSSVTAAFIGDDPLQWTGAVALAVVLFAKARREERLLSAVHPGYADYRARTRAIIPFIL